MLMLMYEHAIMPALRGPPKAAMALLKHLILEGQRGWICYTMTSLFKSLCSILAKCRPKQFQGDPGDLPKKIVATRSPWFKPPIHFF